MMKRAVYIAGLLGCLWAGGFAQELTLTASVDKSKIMVTDRLIYSVVIQGDTGNVPNLKLPNLTGKFDIATSSESTSFQWINGEMASSKTRTYVLMPIQAGTFSIDPTTVLYKGKTISTQSFNILVLEDPQNEGGPSTPQTQNKTTTEPEESDQKTPSRFGNIMLKAWVSKDTVYQGEQLVYGLDFFKRIQIWSQLSLEPATLKGFWAQDLVFSRDETIKRIRNQRFIEFKLIRKALFPLSSGEIEIEPAKVGFTVSPFEGARVLASEPILINVLPLPKEGQPSYFTGVVGDFTLSSEIDQNEVQQNKPITLKIHIKGEGNIKGIKELKLKRNPDFRIYLGSLKDNIQETNKVKGELTMEYIVIPKASGTLTIPAIEFSFFSPTEETYKTLTSKPFDIVSIKHTGDITTPGIKTPGNGEGVEVIREDIHYLATDIVPKSYQYVCKKPSAFLSMSTLFWALASIVTTLFLSTFFIWVKPYIFKTDALRKKQAQAYDEAIKKLKELEGNTLTDASYLTAYQSIFYDFLKHKLKQSVLGLTKTQLIEAISAFNQPEIQDVIVRAVDQFEMVIFAPSAVTETQIRSLDQDVRHIFSTLRAYK